MINAIILVLVFVGGSLLYYFFSVRPRLNNLRQIPVERNSDKETKLEKKERMQKDEVISVIALALHLYSKEINDEEKTVLTLKTVAKLYSPWSSKIYGLRKYPR